MKKFGFTMAEALLTLGAIGFVSVITIPGLINNVKYHELEIELKRTYDGF